MTFIALVLIGFCQDGHLVSQEAPFCAGWHETTTYFNSSEIVKMRDFKFIRCSSAVWDSSEGRYEFNKCHKEIENGCPHLLGKVGTIVYGDGPLFQINCKHKGEIVNAVYYACDLELVTKENKEDWADIWATGAK